MYFCSGEMAEWSIAAVLKTVVPSGTGGSNPSFSAKSLESPVNTTNSKDLPNLPGQNRDSIKELLFLLFPKKII